MKDQDVTGGTLYTTLEPCTNRGEGKTPCAERIIRRRISRVLIGMLDPDQRICGRGIRALREGGIEVQLFPVRYMKKVEDQNRDFIRDREESAKRAEEISKVGLTLSKIELEPATGDAYYKFKLRLHWQNDGDELRLGQPNWIAGGIPIQGSLLGYKYQAWTGAKWGDEFDELTVRPSQKCRVYVGLDFASESVALAEPLLDEGRLGTLSIPMTLKNGHKVEFLVRPQSSPYKPKALLAEENQSGRKAKRLTH